MIYTDHHISNNKWIRKFNENVDKNQLVWHKDKTVRIIYVLNQTDWGFQFDNEIPFILKKGMKIKIEEGKWHRIIKGKKTLSLLISSI